MATRLRAAMAVSELAITGWCLSVSPVSKRLDESNQGWPRKYRWTSSTTMRSRGQRWCAQGRTAIVTHQRRISRAAVKPFWEPEHLGARYQGDGKLGGTCRTLVSLRNPTSGRQVYALQVTEQWAGKSTSWTFTM
jgi:hypothetical protein